MDEKFATSLGWTSRPCGSSVPQFQPFTSLLLLATTSPILDTTRSPNPPLLSPKSGIAVLVHLFVWLPADSTFHPLPTPWHFYCHFFVYGVCKATLPAFPFSFTGELSLKSRRFLFPRIANFSPTLRNLRNLPSLMSRQVNLNNLNRVKSILASWDCVKS
jgi:hypothetical protein